MGKLIYQLGGGWLAIADKMACQLPLWQIFPFYIFFFETIIDGENDFQTSVLFC
jgi:hypothetical protein